MSGPVKYNETREVVARNLLALASAIVRGDAESVCNVGNAHQVGAAFCVKPEIVTPIFKAVARDVADGVIRDYKDAPLSNAIQCMVLAYRATLSVKPGTNSNRANRELVELLRRNYPNQKS